MYKRGEIDSRSGRRPVHAHAAHLVRAPPARRVVSGSSHPRHSGAQSHHHRFAHHVAHHIAHHSAAVSASPGSSHTARHAPHPAHHPQHRRPVHHHAVRHARAAHPQSVLKKEEELVKEEVRFLLSPGEFHIVTFIASLIILAFLLGSMSLIFYTFVTVGALVFAHFLREHHRPHDNLAIIGLFFLPLAFTLMAFRDWFVWLLLAVYSLSAVSTVILYYYHKKAHSPLKIMWQVVYSKIIAVTLAAVLLCVLPYTFPDVFLSVFELSIIYLLPVALVFFFASKFFYLYFFDRRHIRHDTMKSIRYSVIYSLVFIILLMCIYSLFASSMFGSRHEAYNAVLDDSLIGVSNVQATLDKQPEGLAGLIVVDDMSVFASGLYGDISSAKAESEVQEISLGALADDSYLSVIVDEDVGSLRFVLLASQLAGAKARMVENYGFFSTEEDVASLAAGRKDFVDENFIPYSDDPEIDGMLESLDDPGLSVSDFEGQGFLYLFEDAAGLDLLYHADSIFGKQMSIVLRHTELFRQLTRLVLEETILLSKESYSSSVIEHLYANRDADLLPLSSAVRYGVIFDYMQSRGDAGIADFRVDA